MKTLLSLLFLSSLTALCQPAQIILLRHAEKPQDPSAMHLSTRGEERARMLPSLLGTNSSITRGMPVAALYATRITKHDHSQRTSETLSPLAASLKEPIQAPYSSEHFALLAHGILTNSAYLGKTVVICWTHHNLAEFAASLGVSPKPSPWKERTYDRLWVLRFTRAIPQFEELPQGLLPGDSQFQPSVERRRL